MFKKQFVNMVCLPLIAERNAHEICLTQECLQIVRHLLWKQTTTHSLRNNNPMFDGNLLLNLYVRLSTRQRKYCVKVRKVTKISIGFVRPVVSEVASGSLW